MTDGDRLAAIEARNEAVYTAFRAALTADYRQTTSHVTPPPPTQTNEDIRYLLARARQLDALADAVLAGRWIEADEIARQAQGG